MSGPRQPTGALSVAMLAERWGTSDTFVYDQIKAGKLRAFKLGSKLIRIRLEDVEEYEAAGMTEFGTSSELPSEVPDSATIARLIRRHSTA